MKINCKIISDESIEDMTNDEIYNNFTSSVKKILKELYTTYKDLGCELGMKESQIANKMNNKNGKFNLKEMLVISNYLGESIENLAMGRI